MKLWISKQTEVPIREQLVTQITLAVTSGDIAVGEKLPSRGELARRFGIHENTVSNAYKILTEAGLIEFRKGSGFYAKELTQEEPPQDLETLTARYLKEAAALGAGPEEIRETIAVQFDGKKNKRIVLLEKDVNLAAILAFEIRTAIGAEVEFAGPYGIENEDLSNAIPVALADEKRRVADSVPDCLYLNSSSISDALAASERPANDDLIAVASGWDGFLKMTGTILMAAAIEPEAIITRSTHDEGWQKGLDAAALIITDPMTGVHFENDGRLRVFPFIADESMDELRATLS